MKPVKAIALFLVCTLILSLFAACSQNKNVTTFSDFEVKEDSLLLKRGDVSVTVDSDSGMVKEIANSTDTISLEGIFVDVGIGGEYLFGQLGYKDLSTLATYELPTLYPRMEELPAYTVDSITATEAGFQVCIIAGDYQFLYAYRILENALALDVTVSTRVEQQIAVNGVGFLVRGLEGFDLDKASYEFPGATPAGQQAFAAAGKYRAGCSDYCAPAVTLTDGNQSQNILFVDEVEKWTTGCYYDQEDQPCVGFLAAVEGWLTTATPMKVGTLYLPLSDGVTPEYNAISQFWDGLGYHTPTDTPATDNLCAIYSGHPYGTMDTGYFNRLTLAQYAEKLDSVAEMGFDAIWLLPIFSHSGDNVYEPIDQGIIDQRYGGLEEAKIFLDTAHSLEMKVLFDFVPHGPRPVYDFAKEHDDWVSKNIYGENQIEWECVSFDYNNPEYSAYNRELAKYYAQTLSLDGARIDCSMGGLPNWYSPTYLRASASGLQAGLQVVRDLRTGFLEGGSQVLLLPENFHPSPAYAQVTDVFYDMPLYRCIYDLQWKNLSETDYTAALTHYLTAEHESSVAGQLKLRFLGNHDTVTWTYDAQRAQTLYGTDRAKAMWMTLGWIDGVLYIYQGDEDPQTYQLEGENLEDFFTQLIRAKRDFVDNSYDTVYLDTGSPIFACLRTKQDSARLVLVNLSAEPQTYTISAEDSVLTAIGDYTLADNILTLSPYAGMILDTSAK